MKIHTECVPCLLKRVIYEAEQSTNDTKRRKQAISNACRVLADVYDPNTCSATIATKVHKIVYETLNDKDPYKDLKNESNAIAQSLVPRVDELIRTSDTPLKTSMVCSIIGNMMDFGIAGGSSSPDMLLQIFEKTYNEGLGHDDYQTLATLLEKAHRVVLFSDNCGEIVFDKILCRELKKFNSDLHLTLVVRGEPIISDATLEDAQNLKFDEIVDKILTTGCFAIGVDFSRLPVETENAIRKADVILCKGMANYEAFSETEYRPIAYLLRSKCTAIASSMQIPLNVNAIKVYS